MKKSIESNCKRGEIYYTDLSPVVGSEQGGVRPCLVIQNDVGNRYSPTTIVAPLTTCRQTKAKLPTHIHVPPVKGTGLKNDSFVLLEQIRIVDKGRIISYLGNLDEQKMRDVNIALAESVGLIPINRCKKGDGQKC